MAKPKLPKAVTGLKKAEYNPRSISSEALDGLRESLKRFGDISGITYNFRTGNLVAGHQRLDALSGFKPTAIEWGEESHTPHGLERVGWFSVADGTIYCVRGVDWPSEKEKAANIAANSPFLQGEFTADLSELLKDLEATDFGEGLRFAEFTDFLQDVRIDLPPGADVVPNAREGSSSPPEGSPSSSESEGHRDVPAGLAPPGSAPAPSGIRMVQLFYGEADLARFHAAVERAKAGLDVATISEAVLLSLEARD